MKKIFANLSNDWKWDDCYLDLKKETENGLEYYNLHPKAILSKDLKVF